MIPAENFVSPTALRARERRRAFYQNIAERAALLRSEKATESIAALGKPVAALSADDAPAKISEDAEVTLDDLRRQLEGALRDVDAAICASTERYPRISRIQLEVAVYFGIARADILSARRMKEIVLPRQIAAYLAKMLTPLSLPSIGKYFGGKDHTTILHAYRKIERLILTDAALAQDVATLFEIITGTPQ